MNELVQITKAYDTTGYHFQRIEAMIQQVKAPTNDGTQREIGYYMREIIDCATHIEEDFALFVLEAKEQGRPIFMCGCRACPYWDGASDACQHGDTRHTKTDAICYGDEDSYINRVRD